MAKAKESAKETKAVEETQTIDKAAFVARKLAVLNQKSGAMYERAADRVVQNNL